MRQAHREITRDPDEAPIVEQIYQWAVEDITAVEIARRLNEQGILKPSGREWIGRDVLRLLRRELYRGTWLYQQTRSLDARGKDSMGKPGTKTAMPRETMTEIEVQGLIPEKLWDKTQKHLATRSRKRRETAIIRKLHPFLFRGRVFCRQCGQVYHADVQKKKHHYYRHPKTDCPNRNNFKRDDLEALGKVWITEMVDNPETDWDLVMSMAGSNDEHITKQLDKLTRNLDSLDPERKRLIRMATKGNISEDELDYELARIEADRVRFQADHDRLEGELSSEVYIEIAPPDKGYKVLPADWLDGKYEREYTVEEWQAKIREHDIEIEVSVEGELFGTFDASEEAYPIRAKLRSQMSEVLDSPSPGE